MAVWCCLAAQLCQLCQISHRFTSPPRPLLKIFAPVSEFFLHPLQLLPKNLEPGYFVICKIAVALNHHILVMYKEWWEDARAPRSSSNDKLLTNNVDFAGHGSLRYTNSLTFIFWTVTKGKLLLSIKMRGLKKGYHLSCLYKIQTSIRSSDLYHQNRQGSDRHWEESYYETPTQALWWLVTNICLA